MRDFGNYGWQEGVRLEKYLADHFLVRGHQLLCAPRLYRAPLPRPGLPAPLLRPGPQPPVPALWQAAASHEPGGHGDFQRAPPGGGGGALPRGKPVVRPPGHGLRARFASPVRPANPLPCGACRRIRRAGALPTPSWAIPWLSTGGGTRPLWCRGPRGSPPRRPLGWKL